MNKPQRLRFKKKPSPTLMVAFVSYLQLLKEKFKHRTTIVDLLNVILYRFDLKNQSQKTLPTLSNNSFLRYFSFSALYFAQGVPQGLQFYALPAWMASHGYSPTQIAHYLAVIMLPWSFKIVAAPLMDRFAFLPMGRRRLWLLIGQLGLMGGLIVMSFVQHPESEISYLMYIGFGLSVFGIFQDISIDSLAIDVLPVHQQARANGLMWGSKTIGISSTVALSGWTFDAYGFAITMLSFGGIVLLIMLIPMWVKERPMEKRLPWSRGIVAEEVKKLQVKNWRTLAKQLFRIIILPSSIILAIIGFFISVGRGFLDTVAPVLTVQELGWTDEYYSKIFASVSLLAGLLGMFAGGAILDIFGRKRMMAVFAALAIPLFITMALLHNHWDQRWLIMLFVGLFLTLDIFMTIGFFALTMQMCWKPIAATQFTLFMAIANLGLSFGAWLFGSLHHHFEWHILICFYILFMAVILIALPLLNIEKHLEKIDLWSNKT